ncbi:hypothetical protein K439DRAFT_593646 [Ramaria rubella]|nr:hypothetical protein K439DRAFT_593646 [Ramaria rubella]
MCSIVSGNGDQEKKCSMGKEKIHGVQIQFTVYGDHRCLYLTSPCSANQAIYYYLESQIVPASAWFPRITMSVRSRLESAPQEILEEIAFQAALIPFLGPPATLGTLLRISQKIHRALKRKDNPHLYAKIFRSKFDLHAVARRFGEEFAYALEQADELVRRFEGLKRIKRNAYPREVSGDEHDGGLRVDMWMGYIMFLECDGNNARQLIQYAGIDRFALEFVRQGGRLHDGLHENEGWVVDCEINALGMWLFWYTDKERVPFETPHEREEILGALGSLYAGSFKYPSTHAPLTYFLIPTMETPPPPPPLSVFPLSVSPLPLPCKIPDHFGWELTLARPLIIPPVILAYCVRFERRVLELQGGGAPASSRAPATRAEARRTGWTGATGEDFQAFREVRTKMVEWVEGGSLLHEQDWMRLRTCYDPWSQLPMRDRVFMPGMLDGIWEGRWLALPPNYFWSLLGMAQTHTRIPSILSDGAHLQTPMRFRFREHHQSDPQEVLDFDDVSSDGVGSGALRAWLPQGIRTVQREGKLRIYDSDSRLLSTYQTCDPLQAVIDKEMEHVGLYGGGVWDIILTAETEPKEFGEAWGHDRAVGRVRDWDGLVVLVRESRLNAGRWVFRGYVHGQKNLVGRWRETATQVDAPGWEGAWSMMKVE